MASKMRRESQMSFSLNPLDWLKPAADLVDSVGEAIDNNITSDEERMTLKNELKTITVGFKIKMEEFASKVEAERTKRWESDNTHGTVLARNVRPLTLIYLLFVFTLLALTDGNFGEFVVKAIYITVFEALLYIVFTAYFTSRGLEHIARYLSGKGDRRKV